MEQDPFYVEDFFSYELVKQAMSSFEWPEPYLIKDNETSVEIEFPNCTIELSSNGEGGTDFEFISYNKAQVNLHPSSIFEVTNFNPDDLDLEELVSAWPNIEDTKRSINNDLKMLQAYFLPFIEGEGVEWLEEAKAVN